MSQDSFSLDYPRARDWVLQVLQKRREIERLCCTDRRRDRRLRPSAPVYAAPACLSHPTHPAMTEPKNCPWCGGKATVKPYTEDLFRVYCLRCWECSPKRKDASEAIKAWNDIPTQYDE